VRHCRCPSISLSTISTAYFWRIFEKCRLSAVGNGPETLNRFITRTPRGIPSFLRQSLALVKRCRNVEFDLTKTIMKNFTVGSILKIDVTFRSNSAFYSETFATLDSPQRDQDLLKHILASNRVVENRNDEKE
jgi:hypothetical protein